MLLQVRATVGQRSRNWGGSGAVIRVTWWRESLRNRGIGERTSVQVSGDADGMAPVPRLLPVTDRRPAALLVVCLLVIVEAAAFLGLAVAWTVDVVRGSATMPGASLFLAAFGAGVAALLVLAARGLWRGRRWARSPVVMWQILLVVLAIGWLRSEPTGWAVTVLVVAVLIGVGLLLPGVVPTTPRSRAPEV
jgi:hypothetical protein